MRNIPDEAMPTRTANISDDLLVEARKYKSADEFVENIRRSIDDYTE
jgi:hypothetical protein